MVHETDTSQDFYEKNLKIISGINFTRRQIDVIACLMSGWNIRSIAERLSIAPSTIETHLDSISQKLGSSGRNMILRFIEESDQEKNLRRHYEHLFSTEEFSINNQQETFIFSTPPVDSLNKKKRRYQKHTLLIISFIFGTFFLGGFYLKAKHFFERTGSQNQKVYSELLLPHPSALLKRTDTLDQIDKKLQGTESIKTVILSGIGGAGKTTLARQYGRLQKSSVIWEINAETEESLFNSFEELGNALAKTKEEKENMQFLRNIRSFSEKNKQLLFIIKKFLKARGNWFIIYDNIDSFDSIRKYIPNNSDVWGRGKLILTTRNANIPNYSFATTDSVIHISTLSTKEKYTLFNKVLFSNNDLSKKISLPSHRETSAFLEAIPSFPLDVSTAAYYIKDTYIDYQTYLQRMDLQRLALDQSQQNLRKEFSNYTHTRYTIVSLSLKKIIEKNANFKDLLLLMSLIDSQNIPLALLKKFKPDLVVENFVHHLRKNSFITSEQTIEGIDVFSIHRSVHKILSYYIKKIYNLEKNTNNIISITCILEKYIDYLITKGDLSEIIVLIRHCEKILNNNVNFSHHTKDMINIKLGYLYFLLRDYEKSRKILENILKVRKMNKTISHHIPKILIYLSNIYMEIGDYSKAKKTVDEAFLAYKKSPIKNSGFIGDLLSLMGNVYTYLGKYEKAQKILLQSIEIYEKNSIDNIRYADALGFIGNAYNFSGDYDKALKFLEKSIKVYQKNLPSKSARVPWIFIHIGSLYDNLGEYKKAKNYLEQGVNLYVKSLSEKHPDTAWAMVYLAETYINLKDYDKSIKMIETSLKTCNNFFDTKNIRVGTLFFHLGNFYTQVKNFNKAQPFLEDSLKIYRYAFGPQHVYTAKILNIMAQNYFYNNQLDKAETKIKETLVIFQKSKHPNIYKSFEFLGDLYAKKSQIEKLNKRKNFFQKKAVQYYKESIGVVYEHFPAHSYHIKRIKEKIKILN